MDYFSWHYSLGVSFYLQRYFFALKWVIHYFSLSILISTLFAPWKRLLVEDRGLGFNFARSFQVVSFNLISRFIGAIVRVLLFMAGVFVFFFIFLFGMLGLGMWLVIPFLSIPIYSFYKKSPKNLALGIIEKLKTKGFDIKILFDNEAGEFVLKRTGIDRNVLLANAKKDKLSFSNLEPSGYLDILKYLIDSNVWDEEFFRNYSVTLGDFISAAAWWDKLKARETDIKEEPNFGKPGLGREILFGYTPTLNQYSVDLSEPQSFSHHLIGREEVVLRIERALLRGASVFLTGEPGVGKKTVILEFARRAREGLLGQEMSHRRVLELDYNFLFSGSTDLNQKKNRLSTILLEASSSGNVVLMVRDLHRITNHELEGFDFTDILEPYLEKGELKIIAITTPRDYEKYLSTNMRIRKYFELVEVTQPSIEEAFEILTESAGRWEKLKGVVVRVDALRKILESSDEYITDTPFPEKALELLDAAILYNEQKGRGGVIDVTLVNHVLSERTGVSFSGLSSPDQKKLTNLEELVHERLVNQEPAVSLISKILRAKASQVIESKRPIGTFLFLGPTGVGKTETAKVLANIYFGATEILRFDMAEYAGDEGLARLIGSVSKNTQGALTTAIKNKPTSLLLLDEIEKSPSEVYNLFLNLLDEGYISDAWDRKINAKHLFVIATSNAGSEYIRELVKKDIAYEDIQKRVIDYVLKKGIFAPEFLNRFDGVIVYEPLGKEELLRIARIMLGDLAATMLKKNIKIIFANEVVRKISEEGFDPAFGARPMRRFIEVNLGDLLGRAILNKELSFGDSIEVFLKDGKYSFRKN